ncbi:hypothetical protein SISSUDRAFT_1013638 [Sistotremastrum suecicum HHB10207 ss-3]|uniref:PhoX domain-containing protein n=1 Tax=Sistotremastrum suecicum HHB10207 ss-3 TaxID=1314776 RepID=A0A166IL98_9AGAM|nr:hypothetical protein SISSUDRAFT_1013638 [Sistotremastrum suecicum HHB10207 ss-3]
MNAALYARSAFAIGLIAIVYPFLARIWRSPLALIFILPPFLGLCLVILVFSNILIGLLLDKYPETTREPKTHAARPLAFSTPAAWQAATTRSRWELRSPHLLKPLLPELPGTSGALNDLMILIVRDFVLTWYTDISSSTTFPTAISYTLHGTLNNLLNRVAGLDIPDLIVYRILPKITAHVEQFRQSETALRGAGLERHLTQSDELDILLAGRYAANGGKLHPAISNLSTMSTRQSEEAHLRSLLAKALPLLMPPSEASSPAVLNATREILACTVSAPAIDVLADPDFWNRLIDDMAGAAIRQQKMISRVRHVLEVETASPRAAGRTNHGASRSESITSKTDPKNFESFLRSIRRMVSLLDARRLRNDILQEIRRIRSLLANHENDEQIKGERTEEVVAFLDRLYTAKKEIENRISILGGVDVSRSTQDTEPAAKPTLRDILMNPSSLSYYMEYMDRQRKALLVQFWLTVESFKNPLEYVDSSGSEDEEDTKDIHDATSVETVKEDLEMLYNTYFSQDTIPVALQVISPKYVAAIRNFVLEPSESTPAKARKARHSMFMAQRQAERDMEQYFGGFEQSGLWFRAIDDIPGFSQSASSKATKIPHREPSLATPVASPPARQGYSGPTISLGPGALPRRSDSISPSAGRSHHNSKVRDSSSSSTSSIVRQSQDPSHLEILASPPGRSPLFSDDLSESITQESDLLSKSTQMAAIQRALSDILAEENLFETSQSDANSRSDGRQSITSSLPQTQSQPFRDGAPEDDELDTQPPEHELSQSSMETFHPAGPGDLLLSVDIAYLDSKIQDLQSQDSMMDALIRKAELTGDEQELRLLSRSKIAMAKELRELTFQKAQYEQQELDNRLLPGRTSIKIATSTTEEVDGKPVVRYLIEVNQLGADGTHSSGWVLARRYNEFLAMHQRLREKYLVVRLLDFPGKRLVTSMSSSFLESRRVGLEKYIQNLIALPLICETEELQSFLSRDSPLHAAHHSRSQGSKPLSSGQALMRSMYKTVTHSLDDMLFGPSMLDVVIQRLTRQAADFAGIVGSGVHDEDLVAQAFRATGPSAPEERLLRLTGDLTSLEGETSGSSFSAPICDLILAIFELNRKNNWLRRQAVVIILQQVLGGTIERKFRDTFKTFASDSSLVSLLNTFRDALWPGGQFKTNNTPRTPEERMTTRQSANRKLSALIPDLAANMIGRSNARYGARRIFAVLQNRRLNQHIIYTIIDEVFSALFPETTMDTHEVTIS